MATTKVKSSDGGHAGGRSAARPRQPEHAAKGDPCIICTWPAHKHRLRERTRNRRTYYRSYEVKRGPRDQSSRQEYFQAYEQSRSSRYRVKARNVDNIIGVDGEGQGRKPHRYTYLAAANECGRHWDCYDGGKALTTTQCLDFFLGLPSRSLVIGFALGYDWTKVLTDVPDKLLYKLYHEEKRAWRDDNGKVRYKKVKWNGYRLDYMNRRFTVERHGHRVTIWDIWRFFQGKFTKALTDWKIGTPEEIDEIARMKDQRATFDKLKPRAVQAYCQDECKRLAQLGRALIDAHVDAGLKLKSYFGAGSTASALFNKIEIKKYLVKPPVEMTVPVAMAFFGGRFENNVVGPVERKVYSADIASAYPYQITLLPCLLHGKWRHQPNPRIGQIERANLALMHWTLRPGRKVRNQAWGPFPVRSDKGTIAFPIAAKGGWCWKQEYVAGLRIFDNVGCTEAWLYHTDCKCQPFESFPYYYRERAKLGSGGKGDVFKLGPNSGYGKLAQSKGVDPPFQSWVYAGVITSNTRAQLLDALHPGEDHWHILSFATDSVLSTRPLVFPAPVDTGTSTVLKKGKPMPLGGWEHKEFPSGIFCVRPGIWFPLNPTDDDLKEVRARGLGKKILYEQWPRIVSQWEKTKAKEPLVITGRHKKGCHCDKCPEGLMRFVGAKSALSFGINSGVKRSKEYGEWVPHTIKVSFSPHPKREKILSDNRLKLWDYLPYDSVPYDPAIETDEGIVEGMGKDILEEQPDLDLQS